MRVNAEIVNLRVAPSIDSGIVRSLRKGNLVRVLLRDGTWSKVEFGSVSGWVRSSQLDPVPDRTILPGQPEPASGSSESPGPPVDSTKRDSRAMPSSAPSAPARILPRRRPTISMTGGITASRGSFSGPTNGDGFGMSYGFGAGLSLALPLAGPLGVSLDPAYQQKGMVVSTPTSRLSLKTGYAEIPLQLTLGFGHRGEAVVLSAGGFVAKELSCVLDRTGSAGSPCDEDAGFNAHQKLDFGAVGGLRMSAGRLLFGGRVSRGSRDLYIASGRVGRNQSLLLYSGFSL